LQVSASERFFRFELTLFDVRPSEHILPLRLENGTAVHSTESGEERRWTSDDAREVFSAEDREEVPADSAVDGEGTGTLEEEGEAGGAKEDGEFEIHEAYGSACEDDDGAGHDGDDAERCKAGEEAEKEGCGDEEFGDDDGRCEREREAECFGPCGNGGIPTGATEPAETFLHTVVEKDSGCGEAEDERARISRGVEEEIDRVVRHGDVSYHVGPRTGSKSVPSRGENRIESRMSSPMRSPFAAYVVPFALFLGGLALVSGVEAMGVLVNG